MKIPSISYNNNLTNIKSHAGKQSEIKKMLLEPISLLDSLSINIFHQGRVFAGKNYRRGGASKLE